MLDTWILAWAHVLSAVGWLGGGMLFAFVVGPALSNLSPAASGEFLLKVVPGVVRFFQIFAGLTILFGLLLLYNMGGASLFDMSTSYGVDLSIGVTLAIVAFVESEFVASPAQLKAVRMIREMKAAGLDHPAADFPKAVRMATLTAQVTLVLLLATSAFMVGAGFY